VPQLDWPIWWMAPFFDGSGYGREAATYVLGMIRCVLTGQNTCSQRMIGGP
jgi:hypothetical protein